MLLVLGIDIYIFTFEGKKETQRLHVTCLRSGNRAGQGTGPNWASEAGQVDSQDFTHTQDHALVFIREEWQTLSSNNVPGSVLRDLCISFDLPI